MSMTLRIAPAAILTLLVLCHVSSAQTPAIIYNFTAAAGEWRNGSNWDSPSAFLFPAAEFDEGGIIGTGGLAFVAGTGDSTAGIAIENGTLEIRSGGELTAEDGFDDPQFPPTGRGPVFVGQEFSGSDAGTGTLSVLGGGSFTANSISVGGAGASSINLSGSGSITINGNADLSRTTRISGSAASFSVGGDLTVDGSFMAEITNQNSHTPINVAGSTTLGGELAIDVSGFTPVPGNSWSLISGSTGVTRSFDSLSVTGPALAPGLGYKVNISGGNVDVAVSELLRLSVNRETGAASINGSSAPIDMELYAIRSEGGFLTPDTWLSLDTAGFDNDSWRTANPAGNPFGLAEARANPLGASTIATAQSVSLGSVLNTSDLELGESREDLTFAYLEPGNSIFTLGVVEYEGGHNNLVLIVDPSTGEAAIQNQSAFDATINLYAIASESGALAPDSSETLGVGWDSFEEMGVDGGVWQRGSGSTEVLAEANPASATTISSGAQIDLGTPWDMTSQDLTFQFLLEGDSVFTQGIVEYRPIISDAGDFNGDGRVDGGDFLAWQRAHPSSFDLADWEANFGNTGSGSGSVVASAPEPSALTLFALGALAAIVRCRSRNG